jgi:oligopeptide/dipeptide ABC transporter ATP-binding protein
VSEAVLAVRNLSVTFDAPEGAARAVDHLSLDVHPGETLGLVGESGCGKSVAALALLGLVHSPTGRIHPDSEVLFEGRNLLALTPRELRAIRGNEIALIPQEPMTALNPVLTVGSQVSEVLEVHQRVGRRAARTRARELLGLVGLPEPADYSRRYPHELSGGMRQRALIAMALACHPKVLIADEPTTALDVTVQAQIVELLARLSRELGMSMILITHDLGVVAGVADRVAVMYGGQVVETATAERLFESPRHPYTAALLAAAPHPDQPRTVPASIPGMVPPATAWPGGCRFHPRCGFGWERCAVEAPPLFGPGDGESVRCWLVDEPERRRPT